MWSEGTAYKIVAATNFYATYQHFWALGKTFSLKWDYQQNWKLKTYMNLDLCMHIDNWMDCIDTTLCQWILRNIDILNIAPALAHMDLLSDCVCWLTDLLSDGVYSPSTGKTSLQHGWMVSKLDKGLKLWPVTDPRKGSSSLLSPNFLTPPPSSQW